MVGGEDWPAIAAIIGRSGRSGRHDIPALRWPIVRRPPDRAALTAKSDAPAWRWAWLDSRPSRPNQPERRSAVARNGRVAPIARLRASRAKKCMAPGAEDFCATQPPQPSLLLSRHASNPSKCLRILPKIESSNLLSPRYQSKDREAARGLQTACSAAAVELQTCCPSGVGSYVGSEHLRCRTPCRS